MVETKDLNAFIRKQEYKLQAKIYARKYEKLAAKMDDELDDEQGLSDFELSYDYDSSDGVWLERGALEDLASARSDDALARYELKFLH